MKDYFFLNDNNFVLLKRLSTNPMAETHEYATFLL